MSRRDKSKLTNVIDFSEAASSPGIKRFSNRMCLGEFTVCQCTFSPNAGFVLSVRQLVIGIYTGSPFRLTWREGEADKVANFKSGQILVLGPETTYYVEWPDTAPRFNIVAIEKTAVDRILAEACTYPASKLRAAFGVNDRVVRQLIQAWLDEVSDCGECGQLFTDGLASAIVTHVYRTYGNAAFPKIAKGGLTPRDAKRVLNYIETHMHQDIGLAELASSVSLSAHYFTAAFKSTLGMPPYRYLLHRRVERAKELLLRADLPPAKIAEEVGFSSQSQFTTNFRKIVGTTPARFRRVAQ